MKIFQIAHVFCLALSLGSAAVCARPDTEKPAVPRKTPGQSLNLIRKMTAEKDYEGAARAYADYLSNPLPQPVLNGRIFMDALKHQFLYLDGRETGTLIPLPLVKKERFSSETIAVAAVYQAVAAGRPLHIPELQKLPADRQQSVMYQTGKLFYLAGDYARAGRLCSTAPLTNPHYQVTFADRLPEGVDAWKNSPLKQTIPIVRDFTPYNQKAAELLVLDVNAARGSQTGSASGKTCPLAFQVAADSRGLVFYGEFQTPQAEQMESGVTPGGMLEMYLQPGDGMYYYQWLWSFFPEKMQYANWNSEYRHFRPQSLGFKHEIITEKDRIGFYARFSWRLFYDCLPDEDTVWTLGCIPWLPCGGFVWGSGQVHELNKFGKLHFEGIGKLLPEIRRRLVMQAWGSFTKQLEPLRSHWMDEFNGDKKFLDEVLNPFLAELEKQGGKVSPDMTEETSEMLFRTCVPHWFEIHYDVDEMRTAYLRNQLLGPEITR